MHLAELNIGRLRAPVGDPIVEPFIKALDAINGIAERSDGYIWRLKGEGGDATEFAIDNDPQLIPNISVWRDLASLEKFVWNTVHKKFVARRAEWFEVLEKQFFVMWCVQEGHEPTLDEAFSKLKHLQNNGANEEAFDWAWFKSK